MTTPTAEDWIILRVLQEGALTNSHSFVISETVTKTLAYLVEKLGLDTVLDMLDKIIDEVGENDNDETKNI